MIKETDLRLWKFSKKKEELFEVCEKISNKNERIEVDDPNDEEYEINSGVEFPGESIEPYYSTSSNLEDDLLNEAILVVEYRESEHLSFAFNFRKNQRIYLGKCEFCTHRKNLSIECKCKRVRYCSESC